MRISDWSSDVCSSDLPHPAGDDRAARQVGEQIVADRDVDRGEPDARDLGVGVHADPHRILSKTRKPIPADPARLLRGNPSRPPHLAPAVAPVLATGAALLTGPPRLGRTRLPPTGAAPTPPS